jgi:hypothetical protein
MMTALGPCATLLANAGTTFIAINEVTTVASVYSLAAFMNGVQALGSDATNTQSTDALAAAFANTGTLVSTSTGVAPLISTGNGIVPQSTIYALADAFSQPASTPLHPTRPHAPSSSPPRRSLRSTPTDTLQAALNIAKNPAANPTGVFNGHDHRAVSTHADSCSGELDHHRRASQRLAHLPRQQRAHRRAGL